MPVRREQLACHNGKVRCRHDRPTSNKRRGYAKREARKVEKKDGLIRLLMLLRFFGLSLALFRMSGGVGWRRSASAGFSSIRLPGSKPANCCVIAKRIERCTWSPMYTVWGESNSPRGFVNRFIVSPSSFDRCALADCCQPRTCSQVYARTLDSSRMKSLLLHLDTASRPGDPQHWDVDEVVKIATGHRRHFPPSLLPGTDRLRVDACRT